MSDSSTVSMSAGAKASAAKRAPTITQECYDKRPPDVGVNLAVSQHICAALAFNPFDLASAPGIVKALDDRALQVVEYLQAVDILLESRRVWWQANHAYRPPLTQGRQRAFHITHRSFHALHPSQG
jgi:hypothetical protein